ncbi:hypothetical protein AD951_07690 [Acetobacter malorum]|uniref:Uncharacterized protein n=1 Tax=Acetobacter malorum TaxID=178901 RepID=A0A149UN25_9PROT|nr:hypothetical protein [Acetobacter malorum]KXV69213.1 hypothetical protein AD951_07690 [Acetobacter malorum]
MLDYRWTSKTPRFGPFHWTIIIFFPLFFVSAALGHAKLDLFITVLYAAYLLLCWRAKKGPIEFLVMLWVRYVYGSAWITRR